MSNKALTCEEANNQDLITYLSQLGFEPKRISGHQYWYLSPFRNERTASFKVNKNINCWYDFGEGKGGTLIDFGIRYFDCSISDFLNHIFPSPADSQSPFQHHFKIEDIEPKIEIIDVKSITSLALHNYLKERKIKIEVAEDFCKEISFLMNEKKYFALGFPNDAGGYELRNSFFKGSTHPKTITSISKDSKTINLFEGFFDFLSYKTFVENDECVTEDYCILNSLSFLDKAKDLIEPYQFSRIFFDRDKSGMKATAELMEKNKKATDESLFYKNNKDLNEWLMNFGLT